MNTVTNQWIKGSQFVSIGLLCGLTVIGCSRSEKVEDEVIVVKEETIAPIISCDNPLVQDRLKSALKDALNQQAQGLAASYANAAEISISSGTITSKANSVLIDIQNAALIQDANANGMTTCQASVSMTLASEDLYQASQLQAANNQSSIQTRLAQNNIRVNNNMLVDDNFSYVVGTKEGQVQARMVGQPMLATIVAEVIAGSAVNTAVDEQRGLRERQQAESRRAAAAQRSEANRVERQSQQVIPLEPSRPAQIVRPSPPTITQGAETQSTTQTAPVATPKSAPKDDSIDMVIIEDESTIY